ncbi:hypothetical protein N9887_00795 [Flavobacteriaceae bacterium]|nr:hypothetical protein [Flavobacteriaceae bacterium]
MDTKPWKKIKDSVYGEKGTGRRDELDRDFEFFKIGLLLRNARKDEISISRTLYPKEMIKWM